MQLFCVDATIFSKKKKDSFFAHENLKTWVSKVAHNRPQTVFFTVLPGCPNQPRIDLSYYTYVQRLICLLICGQQFLVDLMNSESLFLSVQAALIWALQENHLISPLMKYLGTYIFSAQNLKRKWRNFFCIALKCGPKWVQHTFVRKKPIAVK